MGMHVEHESAHCPHCGPVMANRNVYDVPHIGHLIMTICTCTFWLNVWALHMAFNAYQFSNAVCSKCGVHLNYGKVNKTNLIVAGLMVAPWAIVITVFLAALLFPRHAPTSSSDGQHASATDESAAVEASVQRQIELAERVENAAKAKAAASELKEKIDALADKESAANEIVRGLKIVRTNVLRDGEAVSIVATVSNKTNHTLYRFTADYSIASPGRQPWGRGSLEFDFGEALQVDQSRQVTIAPGRPLGGWEMFPADRTDLQATVIPTEIFGASESLTPSFGAKERAELAELRSQRTTTP